ncbi:hypothetical protein QR680_006590 [Steinernema hermaphroditum]|uniref:Uncharacterized protein n=1 Tax=Steinernema hermaphroditum TaxID=289476 RepID=A0AA39LWS8_9BILA|nr:hypothetical protein QR680_006590 [Steinernema hermaphroditum]
MDLQSAIIGIVVDIDKKHGTFTCWVPSKEHLMRAKSAVRGGSDLKLGSWFLAKEIKQKNKWKLSSVQEIPDVYPTGILESELIVVCPARVPPLGTANARPRAIYCAELGWAVAVDDETKAEVERFAGEWATGMFSCPLKSSHYEKLMARKRTPWLIKHINACLLSEFYEQERFNINQKFPWEIDEDQPASPAESNASSEERMNAVRCCIEHILAEVEKIASDVPETEQTKSAEQVQKASLQITAYEPKFENFLAEQVLKLQADLVAEIQKKNNSSEEAAEDPAEEHMQSEVMDTSATISRQSYETPDPSLVEQCKKLREMVDETFDILHRIMDSTAVIEKLTK